jgi:hypothetical protein
MEVASVTERSEALILQYQLFVRRVMYETWSHVK